MKKKQAKKPFIERKLQEKDAKETIRTYQPRTQTSPIPLPEASYVDEKRSL
jgi:hypothetical protein